MNNVLNVLFRVWKMTKNDLLQALFCTQQNEIWDAMLSDSPSICFIDSEFWIQSWSIFIIYLLDETLGFYFIKGIWIVKTSHYSVMTLLLWPLKYNFGMEKFFYASSLFYYLYTLYERFIQSVGCIFIAEGKAVKNNWQLNNSEGNKPK